MEERLRRIVIAIQAGISLRFSFKITCLQDQYRLISIHLIVAHTYGQNIIDKFLLDIASTDGKDITII